MLDSGATETVMGEHALASAPTTEGPAFNRGMQSEVANGIKLGGRKFTGVVETGAARSLTALVCAVNKCLMSVSKTAKAGDRVVCDDDEGNYMEDKQTKERIWMTETRGMYSITMWIERGDMGAAAFSRPGR